MDDARCYHRNSHTHKSQAFVCMGGITTVWNTFTACAIIHSSLIINVFSIFCMCLRFHYEFRARTNFSMATIWMTRRRWTNCTFIFLSLLLGINNNNNNCVMILMYESRHQTFGHLFLASLIVHTVKQLHRTRAVPCIWRNSEKRKWWARNWKSTLISYK